MKQFLTKWVEQYLFFPTPFQHLISVLMFPFTIIYCVITAYKRISAKPFDFGIPVISIGNLIVGGTGKTPMAIALSRYLNEKNPKDHIAIVLRGYGRVSKGLFIISKKGKLLEDVHTSGDEAMLLAKSLKKVTVIVSENRAEAIVKAKELGCNIVLLDDGYSKHFIKKFDLLIRPKDEPTNIFCLPSGGYRDTKMMYSFADLVLRDSEDFKRVVKFKKGANYIEELPENLVVLTAISKANRLLEFLPEDVEIEAYPDHHSFTKEDIEDFRKKYPNSSVITTAKDIVKLEKFNMKDFYLMDLELEIDSEKIKKIENYINSYKETSN